MILRKHIPIIFYIILLLALILGTAQDNDFIIGDFLLSKIGVPLWSNGVHGLHYSGVITLLMIVTSLIGFSVYSNEVSSTLKKIAIVTFLFGHLLFKPAFSETYGLIKASMGGLDSVDYLRMSSDSSFKSTPDEEFLRIESNLTFENYGSEEQRFHIKLILDEANLTNDKQVVAKDEQTKRDKEFILSPKSKTTLKAVFFARQRKGISGASGDFTASDISISNGTDETAFIRGHY